MIHRQLMIAAVVAVSVAPHAAAQQAFVAISGGATVGTLYGAGLDTDSRWGGTAGVSLGYRNWEYLVVQVDGAWVQKGGADTRLDYIEVPVLVGAAMRAANGLGARLYTGLGIAFPVSCSSQATEFACDLKRSPEWAWPIGLQVGRWTPQGRFFALDVRYSVGLTDAFDVTFATNRSWQFRAYVGFPVGG